MVTGVVAAGSAGDLLLAVEGSLEGTCWGMPAVAGHLAMRAAGSGADVANGAPVVTGAVRPSPRLPRVARLPYGGSHGLCAWRGPGCPYLRSRVVEFPGPAGAPVVTGTGIWRRKPWHITRAM